MEIGSDWTAVERKGTFKTPSFSNAFQPQSFASRIIVKKFANTCAFEKVCASFWYKLFFRVIRELNLNRAPITASACLMDNHEIYQPQALLKNSTN